MIWRLALSGSSGTGKTTLAQRLAAELGVPYIEEGMRTRLEGGLQLHKLSHDEHRELLRELWVEQRERELAAKNGFVADRSSLDFAAFWIHFDFHYDAEETDRFVGQMQNEAQLYQRIVLLPWGVLPLAADGVRSSNRWTQLRFQSILEGVLQHFSHGDSILRVPRILDLDDRVRAVLEQLGASAKA